MQPDGYDDVGLELVLGIGMSPSYEHLGSTLADDEFDARDRVSQYPLPFGRRSGVVAVVAERRASDNDRRPPVDRCARGLLERRALAGGSGSGSDYQRVPNSQSKGEQDAGEAPHGSSDAP
jgi:hypothetical protein